MPGTPEPSHPASGMDRDGTTPAPEQVRWGETSHVLMGCTPAPTLRTARVCQGPHPEWALSKQQPRFL